MCSTALTVSEHFCGADGLGTLQLPVFVQQLFVLESRASNCEQGRHPLMSVNTRLAMSTVDCILQFQCSNYFAPAKCPSSVLFKFQNDLLFSNTTFSPAYLIPMSVQTETIERSFLTVLTLSGQSRAFTRGLMNFLLSWPKHVTSRNANKRPKCS